MHRFKRCSNHPSKELALEVAEKYPLPMVLRQGTTSVVP
jgi:hypothetical protein